MIVRFLTCIVLATAAWLAMPAPARAAQSYDNCAGFIDAVPAVIATQGTWCLRKDLSTAMISGRAIEVAANNVTIDCNHFKIGGLAAGTGTVAIGIFAENRRNMTVRQCNIRGFREGIATSQGGGHLIEQNRLDSNTLHGVWINSPGSTIRDNRVIDTGGSTALSAAHAYAIRADNGIDVIGNTVNGVMPGGTDTSACGVCLFAMNSNQPAVVADNRIRGLAPNGNNTVYGVSISNTVRTTLRGNTVQGSGVAGSIGIRCSNNHATARDNIVGGFATGIENCTASGNTVNPN